MGQPCAEWNPWHVGRRGNARNAVKRSLQSVSSLTGATCGCSRATTAIRERGNGPESTSTSPKHWVSSKLTPVDDAESADTETGHRGGNMSS